MDSKLVLELSSCPPEPGNGLQHVAKQPLLQQQPFSPITKLVGARRRRRDYLALSGGSGPPVVAERERRGVKREAKARMKRSPRRCWPGEDDRRRGVGSSVFLGVRCGGANPSALWVGQGRKSKQWIDGE